MIMRWFLLVSWHSLGVRPACTLLSIPHNSHFEEHQVSVSFDAFSACLGC